MLIYTDLQRQRVCISKQERGLILNYAATYTDLARVWMQNSKFQIFFRHLHGDLNLDEIKKRIATAVCKCRDESNEPN